MGQNGFTVILLDISYEWTNHYNNFVWRQNSVFRTFRRPLLAITIVDKANYYLFREHEAIPRCKIRTLRKMRHEFHVFFLQKVDYSIWLELSWSKMMCDLGIVVWILPKTFDKEMVSNQHSQLLILQSHSSPHVLFCQKKRGDRPLSRAACSHRFRWVWLILNHSNGLLVLVPCFWFVAINPFFITCCDISQQISNPFVKALEGSIAPSNACRFLTSVKLCGIPRPHSFIAP